MTMRTKQLTIKRLESFCKHYDLTLEIGTKCFYLSETHCMMSGASLRRCISLAIMLDAHFYVGTTPSGRMAFVLYNVGSTKLPF